MASLSQIRQAIADTVTERIPDLHGYPTIETVEIVPAVVVLPVSADFDVSMGRGTDTYEFDLAVLVSGADLGIGQDQLDAFLTGAGDKSIRAVVFANKTLGLGDTNAHIASMSGYGTQFDTAPLEHIGALLRLVVHTKGTE